MKTTPPLLSAVAITTMVSCSNSPEQRHASANLQSAPSLSEQVFRDVNAFRRDRGARELQRHAGLDRLAMEHCEYLRQNRGTFELYGKNVSHMGADGRSLVAMRSFNMINCCEIVASTKSGGSDTQTAKALVMLWQKSHDHEEAMQSTAWTHTGAGTVVDADGTVFATELFATANNSQIAARERFNRF